MTTVRLATPSDRNPTLQLVSALLTELGGTPPPADAMSPVFDALTAGSDAGFVVIGEDDGNDGDAAKPIAVCTVSFLTAIRTRGRYAIIQEMYVAPAARSTGIGMQALQFALTHAAAHGCNTVELGTPYDGQRQIAFYRRAGFTEVGARLRWRAA